VIDPIDGTSHFARRVPLFNTRLAVEDEHGPAIGVINQPVEGHLVFAGRGRGCWRLVGDKAAERTRVGSRRQLRGARATMLNPGTWSAEFLLALHRRLFLLTGGGTLGLVTGQVDALVTAGAPMGYEDLAPLPVIVGEAGGRVTDLAGGPVLTGDGTVLATNGRLHDELLDLVRGIPHARDWRALIAAGPARPRPPRRTARPE
jgi:histidinol-phosphatase